MVSARSIFDRTKLKWLAVGLFCTVLLTCSLASYGGKFMERSRARAERERQWLRGEGAFFVRKGCTTCHSIGSFGIEAGRTGPDLSDAVVDVERRFGKSLEEFLDRPTGTMNIVLTTRILLTDAEKQEAIERLKLAYQRKLERQARISK